jgi:hypothetical protein
MVGRDTVPAQVDDGSGALGPVVQLPIDSLRSPKEDIDLSTTTKFRRFKATFDKMRQGSVPPPLIVIRGSRGRTIPDVGFNF